MELSVRDLTVVSQSGDLLLELPRLDVAPGTTLGVRGASGAGKSTLLKALMGLLPRTTGDVIWGNTDLLKLSDRQRAAFRRKEMGMVFQDFLLFEELGAADNAAVQSYFSPHPTRDGLTRSAEDLLSELGIDDQKRPVASFSGG